MVKKKSRATAQPRKEVAFYYPGPVWSSGDWIKNLILFFDGVALLVPDYIKEKPYVVDPAIAAGLENERLLHILEPEKIVDKTATKQLGAAMTKIIDSGALDQLAKQNIKFHELSHSRLGSYGDPGLADAIFKKLKDRGLARDTEDGKSIPMHPKVRGLVLVLLAQILRPYGDRLGFELSPATDRFDLVESLRGLLSMSVPASSGQVVSLDLETVGVDLGPIPLNEILSFRRQHLKEHRTYARAIRRFVSELSSLPEKKRAKALEDRQEELRDLATDLRRASTKAWKRPAYFALTALGTIFSFNAGGPIAATLAAAIGLLGTPSSEEPPIGAYSYVFKAAESYSRL